MAAPSRFTPAELRSWRRRYGLTVREMAWLLGVPLGTLRNKLSGRYGARLDTDRMLDCVEMLLHLGVRPPGWPGRLIRHIHDNNSG